MREYMACVGAWLLYICNVCGALLLIVVPCFWLNVMMEGMHTNISIHSDAKA